MRSIAAYALAHHGLDLPFLELTINQHRHDLLHALYSVAADCYLFSCYIWNIELIKSLIVELKKLCPNAKIILGGPEADWQAKQLLGQIQAIDCVICGEGEQSVCLLIKALEESAPLCDVLGIACRQDTQIIKTAPAPLPELAAIPFAYRDLDALCGRIPYYESMRGCPFSCSYCLSSLDKSVRFRPLETVFGELSIFLQKRVPQVKFVDRTFNCDHKRALAIWRFLHEHDNGVTNFHFEMAGDLLDEESVAFLSTVRPGLFQFEIGVQSTNPETLDAISRPCDNATLAKQVKKLMRANNIHIHLDLIAGLPYENFTSFARSFDDVYALCPEQLQLGFLKVLGGTKMRKNAEAYGIIRQETAPYEAMQTNWLSYEEFCTLHGVADMVEQYYNSGRFTHIMRYILRHWESPFACYLTLWQYFDTRQQGAPLSKIGYYDLLYGFMQAQGIPVTERARWLCKYDLLLHEKPRKLPTWAEVDLYERYRGLLSPMRKQAGADEHIEVFPFLPPDGAACECLLRFDYQNRDIAGHAAVEKLKFNHNPSER